jgi:pimeloyl-ACP methyl ester carboxylesterase
MDAEPFLIEIPEETLVDLRERLARTRWEEAFAGRGWPAGASLEYLKQLAAWWLERFDWREQEAALNAVPHFRADLDGVSLHFVHHRGRGPNPLALVLVHGWPSTFFEYLKILPLLTDPAAHGGDPADSFDVVIPSLPGYGFSDPLPHGEFRRVPELLARLASDVLGYERFGAYGGDIGGMVVNRLALEYPERLVGVATSFPAEPYLGPGSPPLTGGEQAIVDSRRRRFELGTDAYTDIGRTRPARLAVGLNDSPAGLAAWLLWFWREWSDCDGDLGRRFSKDELLTTLTLYWATETIGTSFLPYDDWALGSAGRPVIWEDRPEVPSGVDSKPLGRDERIDVPTGVVLFSLVRLPREWADRAYTDIRRFTEMPSGGHFGAMEEPQLLAEELRALFRPLRPDRS